MTQQGKLRLTIEGPWAARLVSNPSAREWLRLAFQDALDGVIGALGGDGLYIVQVEELRPMVLTGRLHNCAISWTRKQEKDEE